MTTLSVRIPASVPVEVIRAALLSLGAQIVERVSRKAKAALEVPSMVVKRRVIGDAVRLVETYPDLEVDDEGYYVPREIDGIEVASLIRKMELKRAAELRADPHRGYGFADMVCFKGIEGAELTAAYVRDFCQRNTLTQEASHDAV